MPPTKFQIRQAQKKGRRYGIRPSDLLDLMEHESGFNPGAVSSANAQGLTQFIPSTAASYGVKFGTSKRAQKSQISGAAKYLKDLGWGRSTAAKRKALAGYYGAASPYADDLLQSEQYAQYDKGKKSLGIPGASRKTQTSRKQRVLTSPGVSYKAERRANALALIQKEDKTAADYIQFATTKEQLKDQPAQYKTIGGGTKGAGKTKTSNTNGTMAPALHGKPTHKIVELGKLAQGMGLNVGENPKFGGVDPVHATGSYHYSGRAIDVSGDVALMRKFANKVAKRYGSKLAELFWNGPGYVNIDNGQKVQRYFVDGHTDHVHVAI